MVAMVTRQVLEDERPWQATTTAHPFIRKVRTMKNIDLVTPTERLLFTEQSLKQKSDRYFKYFIAFAAVYFVAQLVRPAFIF